MSRSEFFFAQSSSWRYRTTTKKDPQYPGRFAKYRSKKEQKTKDIACKWEERRSAKISAESPKKTMRLQDEADSKNEEGGEEAACDETDPPPLASRHHTISLLLREEVKTKYTRRCVMISKRTFLISSPNPTDVKHPVYAGEREKCITQRRQFRFFPLSLSQADLSRGGGLGGRGPVVMEEVAAGRDKKGK